MIKADPRLGVTLRDVSDRELVEFRSIVDSLGSIVDPERYMDVRFYVSRLLYSRIPRDYWPLYLPDLSVDSACKKIVQYYVDRIDNAADRGIGMIFIGPNGTGKTSLMCEAGKYAMVQLYAVQYLTLAEYIESCRKGGGSIDGWIDNAGFILLDEVDKVYVKQGSDYVIKQIDLLLRRIINAGKVLIMASNWTWDEMQTNLEESICSLLKRKCKVVTVLGNDMSNTLNDRLFDQLDTVVDYNHPNILKMARIIGGNVWPR